jgi:hypothetical protein
MKTPILKYSLGILLLILPFCGLYSQENSSLEEYNVPDERLEIITDRDIYSINEEIYFSVYNLSSPILKKTDWSNVACLELISPDGHAFIQKKFKLDSSGCAGTMKIPSDMLTGNYYLRAYTKWMLNFSPYAFGYKLITVINAGNNNLLPKNTAISDKFVYHDTLKQSNALLKINLDKQIYTTREQVSLKIVSDEASLNPGKFTLSVIKKDVLVFDEISLKPAINTGHFLFIPETRGLSISGRIISGSDSAGLENKLIHLTMLGKTRNTLGCFSVKDGKFYFSLPDNYSATEIFINTATEADASIPAILVDNDFCSRNIELPYVPIDLGKSMADLYNEISVNSQINQKFFPPTQLPKQDSSDTSLDMDNPFYGKPDFVLDLDKYIPLPALKDYFEELVPFVGIRQQKTEKYFQVLGIYHDLHVYDPLVMVDMVAISEASRILAIPPKKVKQIDVVNRPYIHGNIIYGGVINIISRSADFAGVDLPAPGQFFKYAMYEPSQSLYIHTSSEDKHIPLPWNCLYWNASIKLTPGQIQKINFPCGDTKGEYIVILRGYDQNGKLISNYNTFKVQ